MVIPLRSTGSVCLSAGGIGVRRAHGALEWRVAISA